MKYREAPGEEGRSLQPWMAAASPPSPGEPTPMRKRCRAPAPDGPRGGYARTEVLISHSTRSRHLRGPENESHSGERFAFEEPNQMRRPTRLVLQITSFILQRSPMNQHQEMLRYMSTGMNNFPTVGIFLRWESEPRGSHILTRRAGHQHRA